MGKYEDKNTEAVLEAIEAIREKTSRPEGEKPEGVDLEGIVKKLSNKHQKTTAKK